MDNAWTIKEVTLVIVLHHWWTVPGSRFYTQTIHGGCKSFISELLCTGKKCASGVFDGQTRTGTTHTAGTSRYLLLNQDSSHK